MSTPEWCLYGAQHSWEPQHLPWTAVTSPHVSPVPHNFDDLSLKNVDLLLPDIEVPDIPGEWMEDWTDLDRILGPEDLSILDHGPGNSQSLAPAPHMFNGSCEIPEPQHLESTSTIQSLYSEHCRIPEATSQSADTQSVTDHDFSPHTTSHLPESLQTLVNTQSYFSYFNSSINDFLPEQLPGESVQFRGQSEAGAMSIPSLTGTTPDCFSFAREVTLDDVLEGHYSDMPRSNTVTPAAHNPLSLFEGHYSDMSLSNTLTPVAHNTLTSFEGHYSDLSRSNSVFSSSEDLDDVFTPSTDNPRRRKVSLSSSTTSEDDPTYRKRARSTTSHVPTPDVVRGKRIRKRVQNKSAATRYRMKKKSEVQGMSKEISDLVNTNQTLRSNVEKLEEEISYIKAFLKEILTEKKNIS